MSTKIIECGDRYYFLCPHCDGPIEVLKSELNCAIFRHACYYTTSEEKNSDGIPYIVIQNPINPHMPQEQCESLLKEGKILGCAKPFKIDVAKKCAEKCGYI